MTAAEIISQGDETRRHSTASIPLPAFTGVRRGNIHSAFFAKNDDTLRRAAAIFCAV
ncbi:MAG: hypothetical protein ACI9WS_003211 [Paraglaciecola psychrophila]|jgi:hypothetical protein